MIEKMVVGVDGTDDSVAALGSAVELAEESGASLVVVHVRHESAMAAEGVGAGAAVAITDTLDQVEQLSRRRALGLLSERKIHWKFEVASGDPATQLIAAAQASQATTIVVGGRSHGLIGGMIVGSVAQKLVRHSPVSVLVVRDGHAHHLEVASSGARPGTGDG